MSQKNDTNTPAGSSLPSLSPREQEILDLLAAGNSNKQIAQHLTLAVGTVKTHIHNIYGKLEVTNRTQAAARATEMGLLGENVAKSKPPAIQPTPQSSPVYHTQNVWRRLASFFIVGTVILLIVIFVSLGLMNTRSKRQDEESLLLNSPTRTSISLFSTSHTAFGTLVVLTNTPTITPTTSSTSTLPTISPTITRRPNTATSRPTNTYTLTATQLPPTAAPTQSPTLPLPTIDITLTLAQTPVNQNGNWAQMVRQINSVEMVLVPAGCFTMGSPRAQIDYAVELGGQSAELTDEHPSSRQCFEQPFWIDRYEVTNDQFQQLGGQAANNSHFGGGNLPREMITWQEARDFCEQRGGRLPTEREWEYAARGPDDLIFPWGNLFIPNNVVYAANTDAPMEVGSHPMGVSWVGAHDLSGNVWEWVNTIYDQNIFRYPYDHQDGREDSSDLAGNRVIRGGSFTSIIYKVRTAYRQQFAANDTANYIGFRCVQTY